MQTTLQFFKLTDATNLGALTPQVRGVGESNSVEAPCRRSIQQNDQAGYPPAAGQRDQEQIDITQPSQHVSTSGHNQREPTT